MNICAQYKQRSKITSNSVNMDRDILALIQFLSHVIFMFVNQNCNRIEINSVM